MVYQVVMRDGAVLEVENPSRLPDPSKIEEIREPIITATILVPQDYVGPVITLCTQKRGVQRNMQYSGRQVVLTYELPLNEIVMDFFDRLKSVSRGCSLGLGEAYMNGWWTVKRLDEMMYRLMRNNADER
ncbi:hypothetical protein [Mycobacterium tuberculosis]|uniref:hypothetical protein n=1 Tax=Mycobacterium tuberculosis TaxID=1773 RepID=UPI00272D04F5|nr:hypothetical protein [Mycobacterium tuberculosis]